MKNAMVKVAKLRFLLSLLVGVFFLPACSDSTDKENNDEPANNPSYNYELSDQICAVWKITEWESSDKSYFTKDFETSWIICSKENTGRAISYRLTKQPEIHYAADVAVYERSGRRYIAESEDATPIFEIEDFTMPGNKKVMILLDRSGNRYRCETVANPMVAFLYNSTNYDTLSVRFTSYEASLDGVSYGAKELDYIISALPRQLDAAYCVLVEPYSANSRYSNILRCDITSPEGETIQYTCHPNYGFNRGYINDNDFTGVPTTPDKPDEPETPDTPDVSEKTMADYINMLNATDCVLIEGVQGTAGQKTNGTLYKEKDGFFSGFVGFKDAFSINVGTKENPEYLSINEILESDGWSIRVLVSPVGTIGSVCPADWESRIYWVTLYYDTNFIRINIYEMVNIYAMVHHENIVLFGDEDLRNLNTLQKVKNFILPIEGGTYIWLGFQNSNGCYHYFNTPHEEGTEWSLTHFIGKEIIRMPRDLEKNCEFGFDFDPPRFFIQSDK